MMSSSRGAPQRPAAGRPAGAQRLGLLALHSARGAELVRRLGAGQSLRHRQPHGTGADRRAAGPPRPIPSRSRPSCARHARPATRTATATASSPSKASSRASRAQVTQQIGALVGAVGGQLDALQQEMAEALAATAVSLARQIVRSELAQRPAAIVAVAAEAVEALLLNARHVTLRVHPDDHALVAQAPPTCSPHAARASSPTRRSRAAAAAPNRTSASSTPASRRAGTAPPPRSASKRRGTAARRRSSPRHDDGPCLVARAVAPRSAAAPARDARMAPLPRRHAELRRRAAAARDAGPARARHRPGSRGRRHPRARRLGLRRAHGGPADAACRGRRLFRRLRLPDADRRSARPGERRARRAASFARRADEARRGPPSVAPPRGPHAAPAGRRRPARPRRRFARRADGQEGPARATSATSR